MINRRINVKRVGWCWTIAAEPTSGSLEKPRSIHILTTTNKKKQK